MEVEGVPDLSGGNFFHDIFFWALGDRGERRLPLERLLPWSYNVPYATSYACAKNCDTSNGDQDSPLHPQTSSWI